MLKSKEIEIIHRPSLTHKYKLPLFTCPVSAGFPSPAEDYLEGQLDLNQHLVHHPAATLFVRVSGDSMIGAGIHTGDILIVDRALEATHNKVVIAIINGELVVKRLRLEGEKIYLMAENKDYPILLITKTMDFEIWGVVTNVIHPL